MIKCRKGIFVTSFMFIILLIVISSCATVGREFPVDTINRTWPYVYYKYRLFGESITRDLVIRFDSNGVVSSYTFNTTDLEE